MTPSRVFTLRTWDPVLPAESPESNGSFAAPDDVEKINVPLALLPSGDEDMSVVRTTAHYCYLRSPADEPGVRGRRGQEQGQQRPPALPRLAARLDGRSRRCELFPQVGGNAADASLNPTRARRSSPRGTRSSPSSSSSTCRNRLIEVVDCLELYHASGIPSPVLYAQISANPRGRS